MKVLLAFIVSVALMAQLCDCSDSSQEGERQAPFLPNLMGFIKQPAYLSVPYWRDCLGTKIVALSSFWCVPPKKPAQCPAASWPKLVADPILEKCV